MHPTQISTWKKQLLEGGPKIFARGSTTDQHQQRCELIAVLDWLKTNLGLSTRQKRALLADDTQLSVHRQCELLGLARSSYYYQPASQSAYNLGLIRLIDRQYLKTPYYGVGMMHRYLLKLGHPINIKRVRRLYRLMALEALVPKPATSAPADSNDPTHRIYAYLLGELAVTQCNQVWSTG